MLAARRFGHEVILVGRERYLQRLLKAAKSTDGRIHVVHAPEVITMADHPRDSLRKKQSSLAVAAALVKSGEADALVSAGNTGAVLAHAMLSWRTLPHIKKPAIATLLPTMEDRVVVIDSGAVVDARPHQFVNFAAMGACYAREILGRENPRIGILSIGEEDSKGNEQTLAAAALLRRTRLNFLGNAEGKDVFSGNFDVLVCDGFVGNIVLKTSEGAAKFVVDALKREARKSVVTMLGGALFMPAVRALKRRTDYDESGGAPLLGVNGVSVIAHGRSGAKAYMNAIRVAGEAVSRRLTEKLGEWIEKSELDLQAHPDAAISNPGGDGDE